MHYDSKEKLAINKTGVSVPESFFTQIMPVIRDVIELKVILYIFHCLSQKPIDPAFMTHNELLSSGPAFLLISKNDLTKALETAVADEALLHLSMGLKSKQQDIYFVNIESNREIIEQIKRGELSLKQFSDIPREEQAHQQSSNIFVIYEQNIGMITPMLSDELKAATELYPAQWIEEAIKEAVLLNKRSWRYIARILERWAKEGKSIGADRQGNKKSSTNKYISGKYGHLVKR